MTDTTGTIDAPAAPAAEPVAPVAPDAPAAPAVPTPAAPTGPLSRQEAMQQNREQRAKDAADAAAPAAGVVLGPIIDEHGRKHDPATGEYLPGEAEKPSILAAPPVEAAPAVPTGIKVAIPEGHPLRDMGLTEFSATSDLEAQAQRALINSYTRRQEVERLAARNAELEEQALRREARDTAQETWQKSPAYQEAVERYHKTKDLEDAGELMPGTADRVWKADVAEVQRIEQEEITARETAFVEAEKTRYAQEFTHAAWDRTATVNPEIRGLPGFEGWFQQATEDFDSMAARGRFDTQLQALGTPEERAAALHELFREHFGRALMSRPEVVDVFRREQAREQLKGTNDAAAATRARLEREAADAAAVERYKQQLADKRRTAPPHPLASPAAAARPGVSVAPASGEADLSKMTPQEAKEYLKARNREHGRALVQPG